MSRSGGLYLCLYNRHWLLKLKEGKGIDPHELKEGILGKKAPKAQYDIYVDKADGQLWILRKGGQGVGIPTGEFIK